MLFYIISGAVAFFALKKSSNAATTPASGVTSTGRPITPVAAAVATPIKQTTKAPASAQAVRADQGNGANQPWYTGALIAGTGLALTGVAKSLSGMFSQQADAQALVGTNSDYTTGQDQNIENTLDDTAESDYGYTNSGLNSYSEAGYDGMTDQTSYDSAVSDDSATDYSYAGG